MALITKKKLLYPINEPLRAYLADQERNIDAIDYEELSRHNSSIALYDTKGVDTLWETVLFAPSDMENIHLQLKKVYSNLKSSGKLEVIDHLFIDRIDLCPFGNTKPYRVRIVNRINDNFDYFYIKRADASRVYGLELENLLSPNSINYIVYNNTIVEDHIAGVPGDQFMKRYIGQEFLNKVRLSKEFVKFNERCFVRLLGDMHSSNFVVDVTPDFEDTHYRIRAIDFDQQSYESRKAVYFPQYFKQNNPFVEMGVEIMTPESMTQYQQEERSLILNRSISNRYALNQLFEAMRTQPLSLEKNISQLGNELAKHHKNAAFKRCKSMGELVKLNLETMLNS